MLNNQQYCAWNPPPSVSVLFYRCWERCPMQADVSQPARHESNVGEVLCKVLNANSSFYQPHILFQCKALTLTQSFRARHLLLLWPYCCCSSVSPVLAPWVGNSSKIPLRWTFNGEWKTTFCSLWLPPTSFPVGIVSDCVLWCFGFFSFSWFHTYSRLFLFMNVRCVGFYIA